MPYFNLVELIKKYNIPIDNKKCCVCINGERNIGKTTNMLYTIFDVWGVSEYKKIAFIRNQDTQREMFTRDFNSRMKNRYIISGNFIYKLEKREKIKKNGDVETTYEKTEHVGYCAAITTYLTLKSIESASMRYIIFDEYNEQSNIPDLYVKFVNLFTTLERNNQLFFLMMGNRDTANNEFMVKWEIIPEKSIPKQDIAYELCNNDKWYHLFLELGTEQFNDLENKNTLSNYLSQYDKTAYTYRQGGYADEIHFRVVPFNNIIKPNNYKTLWGFILNGKRYAFGSFEYNNNVVYCCCGNDYALNDLDKENCEIFAFDILGYQDGQATPITTGDMDEILTGLLIVHREQRLYFDSYEILEQLTVRMDTQGILFSKGE